MYIKTTLTRAYRMLTTGLILAAMFLVTANANAQNDVHITDSAAACAGVNSTVNIFAPMGIAISPTIEIHADTSGVATAVPTDTITWGYSSPPSPVGPPPCTDNTPPDYTCSGVTVTLPSPGPAATSFATIAGTPDISTGYFDTSIEAQVAASGGNKLCERTYQVTFTSGAFQSVLVLDRSGSMSSTTNIDPPATSRWNAVQLSVNDFAPYFVSTGAATASELGITKFNNSIIPNTTPTFTPNLATITNAASFLTNINTELSDTPGGSTGIGTALQNGIGKFSAPSKPRSIVLFTDGEQNQAPHVELNGKYYNAKRPWEAGYLECTDAAHGHADCSEIPTDINIVTIGIGQPSGDYLTMLKNLATTHDGNYIYTRKGDEFRYDGGGLVGLGTIDDAFTLVITPVLQNSSPQLVASNKGQLMGSNPVNLPAFKVNKRVSGMMLKITYDKKFEQNQLLALFSGIRIEKNGTDVSQYFRPIITSSFTNTLILNSSFKAEGKPDISPEGEYVVKMLKPTSIQDLKFKFAGFADDHILKMKWQVNPESPIVGQSFNPRMTLNWAGNPIEMATVEAWILRPGNDLGDTLATYGGTIDPSSLPDAVTPGYQKYMHLIKNDPAFLEKLKANENKLTLVHQGGGIYEASYNPGDISDIYQILYRVKYDSPDTGPVERLAIQSAYVRVADMDAEASNISTTYSNKTMTINMRPISTVGKFYGPGQQNLFRFIGNGINVVDVKDDQLGGYKVTLACATGCTPATPVTVTILGDEQFSGPIKDFGKKGPWRLSFHVGTTHPTGNFGNTHNSGNSFTLDLEYEFTPKISFLGLLGHNRFEGANSSINDTEWNNLSANIKYYYSSLPGGGILWLNGGVGVYDPESGSTKSGANIGVGIGYDIKPNLRAEFSVNYHNIFTSGSNTEFYTPQIGISYRF